MLPASLVLHTEVTVSIECVCCSDAPLVIEPDIQIMEDPNTRLPIVCYSDDSGIWLAHIRMVTV